MPDKRKHRGKHPEDSRLFAAEVHDTLRVAVGELSWLLTRGYASHSALKLVGDRHSLTARQRMAVQRSACSDRALRGRREKVIGPAELHGRPIGVDGYNLLITIESALSGGMVLVGRDGCFRDLASVHGTYRRVEETKQAVELIAAFLAGLETPRVDWYLDRPVSNSGRLKLRIEEILADLASLGSSDPSWHITLPDSPDAVLRDYGGVIATTDSAVLDVCNCWINLAGEIIDRHIPSAWKVDLR